MHNYITYGVLLSYHHSLGLLLVVMPCLDCTLKPQLAKIAEVFELQFHRELINLISCYRDVLALASILYQNQTRVNKVPSPSPTTI